MRKRYLVDTNVLLEYIGDLLPQKASKVMDDLVADDFNISVINLIEVLGHLSATQEVANFLDLANQYELDKAVVQETISVRKRHKIKLPDAIIAATAIANDLAIISRNTKDFKNIAGLEVIDPYDL